MRRALASICRMCSRVTLNSSGPPRHLWNEIWVFALALAFLTLEWVLRKRKNLL